MVFSADPAGFNWQDIIDIFTSCSTIWLFNPNSNYKLEIQKQKKSTIILLPIKLFNDRICATEIRVHIGIAKDGFWKLSKY